MMRMFTPSILLRSALVALVLSAVPGWMIYDRMQLLEGGREIVLKTEPIDPRDIFRGHYARLGYEISAIPLTAMKAGERPKRGQSIYVAVRKGADGLWHFAGVAFASWPGRVPEDVVLLKGRVRHVWRKEIRVDYGIERYFAPRQRALRIERMGRGRRQPLGVILRVSPRGKAAIAGLRIDGKTIYEEPLW